MIYKHKKSGKTYHPTRGEVIVKIDGVWHDAVIYTSTDPEVNKTFVRTKEDFLEKFEPIKQDESRGH